jgi:hypothetical protein
MKGAKGHHHGKRHKKAAGGREEMWVSGNPDVKKEAEGKEPYDKGDEKREGHEPKKHGGRAKHHRKDGGKVLGLMTGGNVRPRLDRPGRKRGGGVGSDRSPLSSAHRTSGAESHPKSEDSYGGTPK